jgi:anti-sigma regulatory factor (Ser/Thr protein kinase)
MQKCFKRDIQSLEKVFSFIGEYLENSDINDTVSFAVNVAVEEIYTNCIKYNTKSNNDIALEINREGNKLVITITDYDTEFFDITGSEEVNVDLPLEKRQPGGLGIHLVKQMMDEVKYQYNDGVSIITLVKNLENNNV